MEVLLKKHFHLITYSSTVHGWYSKSYTCFAIRTHYTLKLIEELQNCFQMTQKWWGIFSLSFFHSHFLFIKKSPEVCKICVLFVLFWYSLLPRLSLNLNPLCSQGWYWNSDIPAPTTQMLVLQGNVYMKLFCSSEEHIQGFLYANQAFDQLSCIPKHYVCQSSLHLQLISILELLHCSLVRCHTSNGSM